MSLDDKIFDSLQRLERDTGKLVAGQENLERYISAVSENGKRTEERLEVHVADPEAHGQKAVTASWQMVLGVVGAMIALSALIYGIVR